MIRFRSQLVNGCRAFHVIGFVQAVRCCAFALAVVGACTVCHVTAQDWPQWRGPNRDGVAVGWKAPDKWPESLTRKWSVVVGEGHSSPIVVGERTWLLSRQGENEVVTCRDVATGKEVWRQEYPAPYEVDSAAAGHGKGPKSTPTVADGRLFTFGIGGILTGWDAATGKQLWQREFSKQFPKTSPQYGTALSPLVTDGMCIAHVGGPAGGALTAFDVATGETKWSLGGYGPSYASPMLFTLSGTPQIVTLAQKDCLGVSPRDGKLLWRRSFVTDYDQNVVSPVQVGDKYLVVSGIGLGTMLLEVNQSGGQWSTNAQWQSRETPMYMSSPVVHEKRLYGITPRGRGQLFQQNLSGTGLYEYRQFRLGENAAIIKSESGLLVLSTDGDLYILDTSTGTFLRRYDVSLTPTWGHPAPAGKVILIKDAATLAAWSVE